MSFLNNQSKPCQILLELVQRFRRENVTDGNISHLKYKINKVLGFARNNIAAYPVHVLMWLQ